MSTIHKASIAATARRSLLGLLIVAQGLAALPGGPRIPWRYPPGYRGGYYGGFRGPFYGRGGWYGGWGPGFFLAALPFGYLTCTYLGAPWYYAGGLWYRSYDDGYVVDLPPAGIQVPALPPDSTTYTYPGGTYYFARGVWYTADPAGPGYVVAAPPPAAAAARPAPGTPDDTGPEPLLLIPRNGQTEEKMLADRREAQRYAAGQSGYDPARSQSGDPGVPRARQNYLQNLKAFLEGRGYSVK